MHFNHRKIIASTMLVLCWSAASYGEWEEINSKEGKFSAVFPGKPKEKILTVPTAIGDVKAFMLMYEAPDGASAFIVGYSDYPKEVVAKRNAETMLDGARDGAAKKMGGKVVSETKISINNHPGRNIKIDAPKLKMEAQVKMFLVGNRLYQVLAVSKKDQNNTETIKKFLDSFKLKN